MWNMLRCLTFYFIFLLLSDLLWCLDVYVYIYIEFY